MNKTVKTIAWICLVLGLLGMAVDVGAYVFGRSLVTQLQGSLEANEISAFIEKFTDVDEDGDIYDDDWKTSFFDRGRWFQDGGMMGDGRRDDGGFGSIGFAFPFLLLASGPVLTVVGAVMLIVNREQKDSDSKKKKEKSKNK